MSSSQVILIHLPIRTEIAMSDKRRLTIDGNSLSYAQVDELNEQTYKGTRAGSDRPLSNDVPCCIA